MRQFDDNIDFGHMSTLKCALIGIQLFEKGVQIWWIFLKATTSVGWISRISKY